MSDGVRVVAFEDRQGAFVFVPVPEERARYVRTYWCAVVAACPACGAAAGEPCWGGRGVGGRPNRRVSSVHADRRVRAWDVVRQRTGRSVTNALVDDARRDDVLTDEDATMEPETAEVDDNVARSTVDLREVLR